MIDFAQLTETEKIVCGLHVEPMHMYTEMLTDSKEEVHAWNTYAVDDTLDVSHSLETIR